MVGHKVKFEWRRHKIPRKTSWTLTKKCEVWSKGMSTIDNSKNSVIILWGMLTRGKYEKLQGLDKRLPEQWQEK